MGGGRVLGRAPDLFLLDSGSKMSKPNDPSYMSPKTNILGRSVGCSGKREARTLYSSDIVPCEQRIKSGSSPVFIRNLPLNVHNWKRTGQHFQGTFDLCALPVGLTKASVWPLWETGD